MSKESSKPIYLAANKYPLLSSAEVDVELAHENPEKCAENDNVIESCMPSLNNKEKITNFWLCFILGKFISLLLVFFVLFWFIILLIML